MWKQQVKKIWTQNYKVTMYIPVKLDAHNEMVGRK